MDEFLRNLEKSNLLTPEQWQIVRHELAGKSDQSPAELARVLVERAFVTRWQADKLLEGKKNFTIGKYRLLDCIGTGGMGAVFKALHRDMGRMVAIKIMAPGVVKNREAVARFRHEMQAVAALDDPHIVAAFDAGSDGGVHYLVMEYVEGRDLGELIKQPGRLPVDWATECIRQTAQGLQHAHDQGMVHRDIKPTNLLVARERDSDRPQVKILDLGLARFVSELAPAELAVGGPAGNDGSLTQVGQFLGTPDYISPEQATDTRAADIRSDIFSLGCTFFRILTGELPYPGETVLEKLEAREQGDARRVRTLRDDVPVELEAVISKMLARDPRDRYQTPRDVAQALAPFALRSGAKGALLPPQGATPRRAPRNKSEDTRLEQILRSLAESETDQPLSVATVVGRLKRFSPRAWVACGAALLAALTTFVIWQRISEVTLTIAWPLDQREGASLTVAQRPIKISGRETIAIHGRPGSWDLRLRREGYEPVDEVVSLHRGAEVRFTPQWQPTAATIRRADLEALERLVRTAANTNPHSMQSMAARARLREFVARYPASKEARAALGLASRLPWPLDLLDGSTVPPDEAARFAESAGDSGAALVGMFGDGRLTFWNSVTAIAANSDGRLLAGASADGTVRLIELPEGRLRHLIVPPAPPVELAFQPAGPLLAVAGSTGPVTIWNAIDGRLIVTLADAAAPVAFSPDGKLLAVRAARQEIALFDADTGELRRTMLGHSTGVLRGMTFSHSGKMLASFGTDASVVLWDVASGQERRRFPNAQLPLFSPDDAYLAAGTPRGDLTLWDTRTGETQRTLDEGGHPLAFGQNGQTIVSKRLGRAIVWNLATGDEIRTLVEVPELAVVSPDRTWLAGGDDAVGELRVWNLTAGGLARPVPTAGPVAALAFSRDSAMIISGSRDGVLQMFSPDPPAERGTPGRLLKAADLSPDEMLLAARLADRVELLEVSTGSAGSILADGAADLDWLSFSPDGKLLAGFGGWGFFKLSLRLWDPAAAAEIEFGAHRSGTVRTMAWSNDSRWLATAGDGRLVTIWDVARRTERDSLDDFSDRVTALAFHPDGRRLAVACQDQKLVIWDLKTESALPLAPRGGPYQQVSFSRDGGLLAAPAGDRVLIWDTETGKLVAELSTGGGVAQDPVFDSLGKALVAGGDDGTVWRWNNPGASRYRHEPDQTIRVGPARGLVRRVIWAPDDRHLVTLNGNGTTYVLRLADRKRP